MFGDQTNNATAAQPVSVNVTTDDSTLKGVADLVSASTASAATSQIDGQAGTFLPSPSSDVPQAGAPTLPDEVTTAVPAATPSSAAPAGDELLNIKQQALQQLTPLVNHLEQTPLEKFRTTMMLIQASDNKALLKEAYDAAQKIEDDKVRAQALLDVVNEINYFTQPKDQA